MLEGCEFGEKEDELLRLCEVIQPNYEMIQQCISEGADINLLSKYGDNMLSVIYENQENGDAFPYLTKIFLEKGFNVGKYGLSCIHSLVYSSYDKNIFQSAKLLLLAGAAGNEKNWDSLLDAIGTEESYQHCCEGDHLCENIYYTFYEIVAKAGKMLPYDDINLWDDFIGQRIISIKAIRSNEEDVHRFRPNRYALPEKLFFCSESKALIIEGNPNIYSRAYPIPGENITDTDPVAELEFILGSKVTDISFEHREAYGSSTIYTQPNIFIKLDSGVTLRFSTNFGDVPKDETFNFFEIIG